VNCPNEECSIPLDDLPWEDAPVTKGLGFGYARFCPGCDRLLLWDGKRSVALYREVVKGGA